MCKACGCHGGKMEKTVLSVEGMTCGHCKNAVEKAVRGLPGVLAAEVDLTAKKLTVDYDANKTAMNDIKKAVEEAGYKVI